MNNTHDQHILRSVKQLAKQECANYANGYCLPEDRFCCVTNPAYRTIHDGAMDCDYFLCAVLPLQPELNTAVWHEILRGEGQAGEGWKECVRCHKPFVPASNRQRYCSSCGAMAKRARSIEKQRRYRARQRDSTSVTFKTKKAQENQGFPDIHLGQDDLMVILPSTSRISDTFAR